VKRLSADSNNSFEAQVGTNMDTSTEVHAINCTRCSLSIS